MKTPRTDEAWRKYYDESADEMDMKELMAALECELNEEKANCRQAGVEALMQRDELLKELAKVTAERDAQMKVPTLEQIHIELRRQRDEAWAESAALHSRNAGLSTMLAKCADILDEVRTGEDFECVCSEAADAAKELLTRHAR